MNTLRKIANWIWLNKERMILAVMVIVLCFRVYRVINPETPNIDTIPQRARSLPPEGIGPANPPAPLVDPPPPVVIDLWRQNMFNYVPPGRTGEANQEEVELTLLRINETSAGPRASIQSPTAKKWYSEGDKFEKYELLSIDVPNGKVTVYDESQTKRFELKLPE